MSRPVDAREVYRRMDADILALCRELLPLGRREGDLWVEAQQAQGGLGDSLKVKLAGPDRGRWNHYASGRHGDAVDLVAWILFGGDLKQAFQWARVRAGLGAPGDIAPAAADRPRPDPEREKREAAAEAKRQARRRRLAWRIWDTARPSIADTPADWYLKGRGLDLARLGRQPRALRFHSGLTHPETGEARHPALLALVAGPDMRMQAVHRTYLAAGPGGWGKLAGVGDAKLSLGRVKGGFVPLWRGAGGARWSDMPAGETVLLAEGIEDGLSAAVAAPERRVAVAVSLWNMAAIRWPRTVSAITVLAQHDEKAAALAGRDRAIAAMLGQGLEVRLAFPDPAMGKDANDALRADGEGKEGDDEQPEH
jgi:hypothetical protein